MNYFWFEVGDTPLVGGVQFQSGIHPALNSPKDIFIKRIELDTQVYRGTTDSFSAKGLMGITALLNAGGMQQPWEGFEKNGANFGNHTKEFYFQPGESSKDVEFTLLNQIGYQFDYVAIAPLGAVFMVGDIIKFTSTFYYKYFDVESWQVDIPDSLPYTIKQLNQ